MCVNTAVREECEVREECGKCCPGAPAAGSRRDGVSAGGPAADQRAVRESETPKLPSFCFCPAWH